MANIRVIGGDILVVGGAICTNDNCCCPTTICTLDTSNDLDIYFDNISDCVACDVNCNLLNGNTYRCVWDAGSNAWIGSDASFSVEAQCISGDILIGARAKSNTSFCFAVWETATVLPQTAYSSQIIGDCCSLTFSPSGYGGYAIVSVV